MALVGIFAHIFTQEYLLLNVLNLSTEKSVIADIFNGVFKIWGSISLPTCQRIHPVNVKERK